MKLVLTLVLALLTVMTLYDAGHADMYSTHGGMDAHGSREMTPAGHHDDGQPSLSTDCESILMHCATALVAPAMSIESRTLVMAFQFRPAASKFARGRSLASDPPPPRA